MGVKIKYKEGEKIGNCTFIKEVDPNISFKTENGKRGRTRRRGLFRCQCGNEFEAIIQLVKRENTNSCGCLREGVLEKMHKAVTTHGKTRHHLYSIWKGMLKRCEDINDISYKNYGARGIEVCKEWHDINNFIEDMYPSYKRGLQIDRIDNDGNYEVGNCRWVTRIMNCSNRRDNRYVDYKEQRKTVSEWSRHYKIPINTLLFRLNNWDDIDKIFNQPQRMTKKSKHGKEVNS